MTFLSTFILIHVASSKVLNQIGRLYIPNVNVDAVESVDLDPISSRIFAANGDQVGVNVISLSLNNDLTSASMVYETLIPLPFITINNNNIPIKAVTSVKVIPNTNIVGAVLSPINFAQDEGFLVLINTQTLNIIKSIQLTSCFLPDMITTTSNGDTILIACEGEPSSVDNDSPQFNPEGSVQIIDIRNTNNIIQNNINFNSFDNIITASQPFGPKKSSIYFPYKSQTFSVNAEPEYIAVSEDDKYAFVTIQESNAVAVIDIKNKRVKDVFGLGFQSFEKDIALDASDKDKKINIRSYPNLFGMKQPDSLITFTKKGKYYIATANEGDSKDFDESRVKKLKLNPYAFKHTNITELQKDNNLGRLKVLNTEGFTLDSNNNKLFNKLYTFASRNFEIYKYNPYNWFGNNNFELVYSSQDEFERITAAKLGTLGFNTNGDKTTFDARSDDKGPEPEGIAYVKCKYNNGGKWFYNKYYTKEYILTGLERTGGIMVYKIDMTGWGWFANAKFVEYEINRNFSITYGDNRPPENHGDVSPEQLTVIKEDVYGKPLVIVSNTESSSVTVYRVDCGGERDHERPRHRRKYGRVGDSFD